MYGNSNDLVMWEASQWRGRGGINKWDTSVIIWGTWEQFDLSLGKTFLK